MKKISVIFGTRPEAIKLCPLVLALREKSEFEAHVCVTGQHREMLDQVLEVFGIIPDVDLALMQDNQTLARLTSRAITAIDNYVSDYKPDLMLVQGDTTTVLAAALVGYYNRVAIGHVEAGLRTWNKFSPYPEEINRVLASHIVDYHFAPTAWARQNLLKEGVAADRIYVTGNTVIDALHIAIAKARQLKPSIPGLPADILSRSDGQRLVLITGHRRESFGQGFESICTAIVSLAQRFSDMAFVYPVHLNPNVREPVFRLLGGQENIFLIEPLDYLSFVALMDVSTLILTDSGGVQEEGPSLGKPVLVMRDTTERPEGVEAGTVELVGTDTEQIVERTSGLLNDPEEYARMAQSVNPYGDGKACGRIIAAIRENL